MLLSLSDSKIADVSEHHKTSIFRVEVYVEQENSSKVGGKPSFVVYCSIYFSTLKMEAIYCSEKSVDFQRITQRPFFLSRTPWLGFSFEYPLFF
jgi:hypothetical protein